jgi:hypothetical protein
MLFSGAFDGMHNSPAISDDMNENSIRKYFIQEFDTHSVPRTFVQKTRFVEDFQIILHNFMQKPAGSRADIAAAERLMVTGCKFRPDFVCLCGSVVVPKQHNQPGDQH